MAKKWWTYVQAFVRLELLVEQQQKPPPQILKHRKRTYHSGAINSGPCQGRKKKYQVTGSGAGMCKDSAARPAPHSWHGNRRYLKTCKKLAILAVNLESPTDSVSRVCYFFDSVHRLKGWVAPPSFILYSCPDFCNIKLISDNNKLDFACEYMHESLSLSMLFLEKSLAFPAQHKNIS